jgi:hypothetical protein
MLDVTSHRLPVGEFCAVLEQLFNFELDDTDLSAHEDTVLGQLFDEVVLYSPFPDDRARYPGYRSEEDVLAAVDRALTALGWDGTR